MSSFDVRVTVDVTVEAEDEEAACTIAEEEVAEGLHRTDVMESEVMA